MPPAVGAVVAFARIEVDLHVDAGGGVGLDAAGGQLQRARLARLDHALQVGRIAHQLQALVVDDEPRAVDLELAVARVFQRAVAVGELEEAAAVDRQVQRVVGGGDVALGELLRHLCTITPMPTLLRRRRRSRWRTCRRTRRASLGAVGAGVGDVVADHVQALGAGIEAGESLLEAHGGCLWRWWRAGTVNQRKAQTAS
jgi:hypothetical protein